MNSAEQEQSLIGFMDYLVDHYSIDFQPCLNRDALSEYPEVLHKKYEIGLHIGGGGYGKVCKARNRLTGKIVAIKMMENIFKDCVDGKRILREVAILQRMDHPNIIKLIDVAIDGKLEDFNKIFLVFPHYPVDLNTLIKNRELFLDCRTVARIMEQLLSGLNYLGECGILHRDIKPANILLDYDGIVQICDFGLARTLVEPLKRGGEKLTQRSLSETKMEKFLGKHCRSYFQLKEINQRFFENKSDQDLRYQSLSSPKKRDILGDITKLHESSMNEERRNSQFSSTQASWKTNLETLVQNYDSFVKQRIKKFSKIYDILSLESAEILRSESMTKHIMTRYYRPPEVILLNNNYDFKADIWSLGCVFAELLGSLPKSISRDPLFPGETCYPLTPTKIYPLQCRKVNEKLKQFKVYQISNFDQLNLILNIVGTPDKNDSLEYIQNLTARKYLKNFKDRKKTDFSIRFPSADAGAIDLLEKMLCFDPRKRIDCSKALSHSFIKENVAPLRRKKIERRKSLFIDFDNKSFHFDAEDLRLLFARELSSFSNIQTEKPEEMDRNLKKLMSLLK